MVGGITAAATASPFAGRWTSTDPGDGSSQALLVSAGSAPAVTFQDFERAAVRTTVAGNSMDSAGRGEVDGDTLTSFHKSGCGLQHRGDYD